MEYPIAAPPAPRKPHQVEQEDKHILCATHGSTFLEKRFPFREISLVIESDRRSRDSIYGLHRWWARRPPGLMRALLLSSALGQEASVEHFWDLFGSDQRPLQGKLVADLFMGGGSTLIEAARLGANVAGGDVDPLAVQIAKAALTPPTQGDFEKASEQLLSELLAEYGSLYPSRSDGSQPLHFFFLPLVSCPHCKTQRPLYRSLILVRDKDLTGAVVRNHAITAFCPECFAVHHLDNADAKTLECCGSSREIYKGNFRGHQYWCEECKNSSTHRDLLTAIAPQHLIAVECTSKESRRSLLRPTEDDLEAIRNSTALLDKQIDVLHLPNGGPKENRKDQRPQSFGISTFRQLFSPRQLLVLGRAWHWVKTADIDQSVRQTLEITLSNTLTTNNRLCGYATDYGRLSGLFTVRGYSLPALSVELNPLHPSGGRGTIQACIRRASAAMSSRVIRRTWDTKSLSLTQREMKFHTSSTTSNLACRTAEEGLPSEFDGRVDICVFDPPYFDYIAYDELSEFHRAWLEGIELAGDPLLPSGDAITGRDSFSRRLGLALKSMLRGLKPSRPLAFTYHSTNPVAWEAVGLALDAADLRITALWPVRSDGHMGHHSHPGNSEWDLVVVARRMTETYTLTPNLSVEQWVTEVKPLTVSKADQVNMELAIQMTSTRFGAIKGNSDGENCN